MFDSIISNYGAEAKAKLSSHVITGTPEDQILAPIEALFKALSMAAGMQRGWVTFLAKTALTAAGALAAFPVGNPSKKSADTGRPTLFD